MPNTPAVPDLDPFEANKAAIPTRDAVIPAASTAEEKERVREALAAHGYTSLSEGVREVLFAFVESARVREIVSEVRPIRRSR